MIFGQLWDYTLDSRAGSVENPPWLARKYLAWQALTDGPLEGRKEGISRYPKEQECTPLFWWSPPSSGHRQSVTRDSTSHILSLSLRLRDIEIIVKQVQGQVKFPKIPTYTPVAVIVGEPVGGTTGFLVIFVALT